jgi:hypothetical protein
MGIDDRAISYDHVAILFRLISQMADSIGKTLVFSFRLTKYQNEA